MEVCSERVELIPNVWCGANYVEAHMIYDIVNIVTFRGRRSCAGFEVWKCDFRGRRRES